MKISTKGRYALEALLYMASKYENEPVNIREIADKTQIPQGYLEQIFFVLRKCKILDSKRGAVGGYFIVSDIRKLTIGEIIRSVENTIVPIACLETSEYCSSNIYDTCVTRLLWKRISTAIDSVLDGITIYELSMKYMECEV